MSKGPDYWNARYAPEAYAYGEWPNDFLQSAVTPTTQGRAISLCEGEGRNAVFLALQGYQVTAVDFSEVGLRKAQALAARHGVQIDCVVADMASLELGNNQWDLVVAIFAQPESHHRQRLYGQLHLALRSQGQFILESKVEAGASATDRYPGVDILKSEIKGLTFLQAQETTRELNEGSYHQGMHMTAQIQAIRF